MELLEIKKGLNFILPDTIKNKEVSVIEVGQIDESGLAGEINKFLETDIEQLSRINTYVLIHPSKLGLESLIHRKPFVDPIIQRAALNTSLAMELGLSFDYVLQSMLNPGTSDAEGDTALRETLLALGQQFNEGDIGFYSKQYFLKGHTKPQDLEEISLFLINPELYNNIINHTAKEEELKKAEKGFLHLGKSDLFRKLVNGNTMLDRISAFLANPDLNTRLIIPKKEYESGIKVEAPVVILKPDIMVKEYDVLNMSDKELLDLSSKRKLAATLEEMQQFRDIYKDPKFIRDRKEVGLCEKATDVELKVRFGLRSEHCFHKEINAKITLEDKVNDPIFTMAYKKGWLAKDETGNYVLEKGMFKTFVEEPARLIFDKLEKRGKNWIADMFRDNAGTVYYDEDFMFCIKFETHNSPSNKEPVQGAKTGLNGVIRDGMGNIIGTFEVISGFFLYCTGNPHYKGWLPKGVKHPYAILKGITQGVREAGNEMQIPVLGGGVVTDPRYIAKCLVYCGVVGFSPVKSPDGRSYLGKHPNVGDLVLVAGQPVGRDGIDGATESSLSASAYISLGHVQADFSFVQAKMKGYLLECARDNLFSSIGDCGAMGISVALELAKDTGGLILDLEKHPRKYSGIQPWEAAISETQDRMVPIALPENKEEILKRARLHDVQVTELGKLTDSGYAHLKWGNRTVALMDLEKLSNKEPRKRMHATWNGKGEQDTPEIKGHYSLEDSLCLVMSQPDVASKEWFFRQKDSSVKGATIQSPLIGLKQEVEADATIQKPLDTEGRDFGAIAYSLGIAPKLSDIDAYYSAQKAFVDMVGKIISVGGALPDMKTPKWDAWAVCGNYCQPNSDSNSTLTKESGEHNLASFLREGIGVREAVEKLNIPVISGKDSMKCSCVYEVDQSFKLEDVPLDLRKHIDLVEKDKKRFIEIHDPDSYLASCAVKIDDYRKCVNSAFKEEGDLIYVLGTTKNHLGASQYLSAIGYKEQGAPIEGGAAPQVDFDEFIKVAGAVHEAIDSELVASCSYVHNGGINVAIAKAAIAGEKGADINIGAIYTDESDKLDDELLYSETPGRFIVTVDQKDAAKFSEIITKNRIPYGLIGQVTNLGLRQTKLIDSVETIDLKKVKQHYQSTLSFGLQEMKNG